MPAERMRAGVVAVVRHPTDDLVMVFQRSDMADAWQFPQGGVDVGEAPRDAAWRELAEETGLTVADVELVGSSDLWLGYWYPEDVAPTKRHVGQAHQWFIFRARHAAIEPVVDQHEFCAWRWASPADVIDHVVEFRRPAYRIGLGFGTD